MNLNTTVDGKFYPLIIPKVLWYIILLTDKIRKIKLEVEFIIMDMLMDSVDWCFTKIKRKKQT